MRESLYHTSPIGQIEPSTFPGIWRGPKSRSCGILVTGPTLSLRLMYMELSPGELLIPALEI
jgi:hypothetical protein